MESQPQVESIARLESTIPIQSTDVEGDKKPIHISIRLIGDKGVGKASIIDMFLEKKNSGESKATKSEKTSTDTAVDQGT